MSQYMTTAQALEKSIEHWEQNLLEEKPSLAMINSKSCALCRKFVFTGTGGMVDEPCEYCPVMEHTGVADCEGSPYDQASPALMAWLDAPEDEARRATFREHAQRELDFLKSLRTGDSE